jgi:hypothetical protein
MSEAVLVSERLLGGDRDIVRKFRQCLVQAGGTREFRDLVIVHGFLPASSCRSCDHWRVNGSRAKKEAVQLWTAPPKGAAHRFDGRDIGEETGHRPQPDP